MKKTNHDTRRQRMIDSFGSYLGQIETLSPRHWTVGIEQEFFLLQENGRPATHELSQEFLRCLTFEPFWLAAAFAESETGESLLWSVARETNGRRSEVKYDHHPHLLEISCAYAQDIYTLIHSLEEIISALQHTALKIGVKIGMLALLDVEPDAFEISSSVPHQYNLRFYRGELLRHSGRLHQAKYLNYAAVIAATQTHVGGTGWHNDGSVLVQRLYTAEAACLRLAAHAPAAALGISVTELLTRRWLGYRSIFEGFPLVGFPDLKKWDLSTWTEAMLHSPLYGSPENAWSGRSAVDLTDGDWDALWTDDISSFWSCVRDLQIIRPRLFGTLEFRADPAQPTTSHIAAVAALRLGLTLAAAHGEIESQKTFKEQRQQWWQALESGCPSDDSALTEVAYRHLHHRGYGEHRLISDILTSP